MLDKVISHLKKDGFSSVVRIGYRFCLIKMTPGLMYVFRLFGIKKAVVFSHFDGKAYGGNPGIICDEILERNLPYKLIWIADKEYITSLPDRVKGVPTKSLRHIWALSSSKVWVDDCRKTSCFRKGSRQYYIQTWHGGGPCLKKVEADTIESLPSTYVEDAINDSSMADLFLSACDWRSKNYRNAFWYKGEILKCGTPSFDVYGKNSQEIREEINYYFGISDSKHIAFYAPTFRSNRDVNCYRMEYKKVIDSLKKKFGGEWCLIIRLHPSMMNLSDLISYTSDVLNGSKYPRFEDILIASDVLISDYSGCMFEAYRLKKSVFLYAPDLENYIENERALYFDINLLPASIALTSEQLVNLIQEFDYSSYEKKVNALMDEIGYYPIGNATKTVVERIINVLEDKSNVN